MTHVDVPHLLIDHHCHGVVDEALDRRGIEELLTEACSPPAPGTSMFDSQLGFAVRAHCAPVLDLEPHAPVERYVERRAELGSADVNRRFLGAAGIDTWLVDTGYHAERLLGPNALAEISGAAAREVVRLEALAEDLTRRGPSAAELMTGFAEALEAASHSAVGLKSIVAYRYGFDFDPTRPAPSEVRQAADRWLRTLEADPSSRLEDPVLLRELIWAGIDSGLPLQFHVGLGDPDVRLHRANPSLLHDFLLATEPIGTPVLLLHCYPYHRHAGYLANVFGHVYMDVGEALNHVGARAAGVLAEALELTPFAKMLYSSDAYGLPELHYLAARGFRRDLGRVLGAFVADGAWSLDDAERVAELIARGNARRVYRLAGS